MKMSTGNGAWVEETGEFIGKQGWQEGIRQLDSGEFGLGLVVVRRELLETARSRWPRAVIMEAG
jgi:hypothetical protein